MDTFSAASSVTKRQQQSPQSSPVKVKSQDSSPSSRQNSQEQTFSPMINHIDRKVAITERRMSEEADRMKQDSKKVMF